MKNLSKKLKTVMLLFLACSLSCSSDSGDPMPSTDSDISLSKTVDISTPNFNDNVVFTLMIKNEGPLSATGVLVKDILPSGYSYVSDNGGTNGTYDSSSGIWTLPIIESGGDFTLRITASVNSTGDYNNIAEVIASDNDDPDSTVNNNLSLEDDQDSASVSPTIPSPVQVVTYANPVNAKDALAIDDSGNLYASNYFQDYVRKIGTDQSVSNFISNQDGAAGMVFGSDGSMFLARYNLSDILKISSDGSSSEVFTDEITGPIAVDFDSNGNLYTNNNTTAAITKIDVNGNKTTISSGTPSNSSLVLDNDDNIYITDYNSGVIKKIDAVTNTETTFVNLPVSVDGGIAFIIFSDGYFYATSASDHVIYMIDTSGSFEIIAGSQGTAGNVDGNGNVALLNGPIGIVASADGRTLYVAHSGKVIEITGFRE